MIARLCAVATFALACACASAQAVVELVPDPPGPYLPGQPITIHVWLHNQMGAGYEAWLRLVQFDFSQSSSAVLSNLTFAFDYTSVPGGDWGYEERHPSLPVPWTYNGLECVCPDIFFFLPAFHNHAEGAKGTPPCGICLQIHSYKSPEDSERPSPTPLFISQPIPFASFQKVEKPLFASSACPRAPPVSR